ARSQLSAASGSSAFSFDHRTSVSRPSDVQASWDALSAPPQHAEATGSAFGPQQPSQLPVLSRDGRVQASAHASHGHTAASLQRLETAVPSIMGSGISATSQAPASTIATAQALSRLGHRASTVATSSRASRPPRPPSPSASWNALSAPAQHAEATGSARGWQPPSELAGGEGEGARKHRVWGRGMERLPEVS